MKTACKACGRVNDNRVSYDKTKIICENCTAEIPSTAALLALLVKKKMVWAEGEVKQLPVVAAKPAPPQQQQALSKPGGLIPLSKEESSLATRGSQDHFNKIRASNRADPGGDLKLKKRALENSRNPNSMEVRPSDLDDRGDPKVRSDRKADANPKGRKPTPSSLHNKMIAEQNEKALKQKYSALDSGNHKIKPARRDPNYREYNIDDGFREMGLSPAQGRAIAKAEFGLDD